MELTGLLHQLHRRNMTIREFFRWCYWETFNRDAPCNSLEDDIQTFIVEERPPPYTRRFILS